MDQIRHKQKLNKHSCAPRVRRCQMLITPMLGTRKYNTIQYRCLRPISNRNKICLRTIQLESRNRITVTILRCNFRVPLSALACKKSSNFKVERCFDFTSHHQRGAGRMRGACRCQLVQLQFLLQWRVETVRWRASRAERQAGQHYYPADCARIASGSRRAQLTLSPPYLRNSGGSVKVVGLIRFNCVHYYWKGSGVLIVHYDFKEVQININELRAMEILFAIAAYKFL